MMRVLSKKVAEFASPRGMEWLGVADESVKVNLKERFEVGKVRANG